MVSLLYKCSLAFCLCTASALLPHPAASKAGELDAAAYHPFFISVTEVAHNASDRTLEISCKIFADDLENILKKNYKTIISFSAEKDKARLDALIPDYVSKHLALSVDGRPVKLNFIGFEKEKESAFCYFEVAGTGVPKRLDITNTILHDLTPSQVNIMHITVNGKRQSSKLDFPQRSAGFTF